MTDGAASAAEAVFGALWESLADLLGTAATATLLRRALRDAAAAGADVEGVTIVRDDLTHRYALPERWSTPGDAEAGAALGAIAAGLRPLLFELTGSVVLRRLERLEALEGLRVLTATPETAL